MNLHVRIALIAIVIGTAAIFGYKALAPRLADQAQRDSSDARNTKGRIVVGSDNWIGYLPLCSAEMKREMRAQSWLLECRDDKADYAARLQALKSGEIPVAVATVDAYLLNGAAKNFPGTIIAVLDESKGGDALVAWQEQLAKIEDIKRATGVRIAFTPNSPSEHLLKSLATHFDVAHLRQKGPWRVEASGSPDALSKLLAKKAGAAVLWEPDVAKALATPGMVKLLGTEDTRKLIVDVLLVGREVAQKQPEMVDDLLAAYFRVLRRFMDQRELLLVEAEKWSGSNRAQVETMTRGVHWVSLAENAQHWFGAGVGAGIVDAIEGAAQVQVDAGDFKETPVPDRDPYRLVNSQPLRALFGKQAAQLKGSDDAVLERRFAPLDDKAWARLKEVGTLRTRPIVFQSGTSDLDLDGKVELDRMADALKHYPNFRVIVRGHTGVNGDPDENQRLSQERAEAVARYLGVTYNTDANRLHVQGLGGSRPLPRQPDESDRAYNYRLPRVELVLAAESL